MGEEEEESILNSVKRCNSKNRINQDDRMSSGNKVEVIRIVIGD